MSPDVFAAVFLSLILIGLLLVDRLGCLQRRRLATNEIGTISTHPSFSVTCPGLGAYRFDFDSQTERSLVVYVNGKRQEKLTLSGNTRLNIIVA